MAHPQPFVVKSRPPDVEETAKKLGASAKELREVGELVDLVIAGKEHLTVVEPKAMRGPRGPLRHRRRAVALRKIRRKRQPASQKR